MGALYKSLYFLNLLITIISSQLNSTTRQCHEILNQEIDQKILKMTYKSAVFSSMAYLEYEKNLDKYPKDIDFKTTDTKSKHNYIKNNIKFGLLRKVCQLKSIARKTGFFLMNYLLSPFISGSSRERSMTDVIKCKECSLEYNSQSYCST
mmetsp:Transcript_9281/g.9109  ORF Transcript_9281/g.9109 Transcript_9281/m.9109 type:complete len:150 (-) Transcript_9281:672-1121(-)